MSPRPTGIWVCLGSQGGISPSSCDARLGTVPPARSPLTLKDRAPALAGKWIQTLFGSCHLWNLTQIAPCAFEAKLSLPPFILPSHFPSSLQPHQSLCFSVMLGGSCLRAFVPAIPTTLLSLALPLAGSSSGPGVTFSFQIHPHPCFGQGSSLFQSYMLDHRTPSHVPCTQHRV